MLGITLSLLIAVCVVDGASIAINTKCPDYAKYSTEKSHPPFSDGKLHLPYQRPPEDCRTFSLDEVEDKIDDVKDMIEDPDLARLFVNSFPNTLDTAIKWKGTSDDDDEEELTFIITGDIDAMWLRDSSNQLQSYLSLLRPSDDEDSLASLFRGVINLQARYLYTSPYCNSFQAPTESDIKPASNGNSDQVTPKYDPDFVFECKYELDSLAAFLQVSVDYYTATHDVEFFKKFHWIEAVQNVLSSAEQMGIATYADDGSVNPSPYTFVRNYADLVNNGYGSPANGGTGLLRSAFRPSDDATLYQFFIPGNMMFSSYLKSAATIMEQLDSPELLARMLDISERLDDAIQRHGVVSHPTYGDIYAFEIDGYGGINLMDDANIPSLLSIPMIGFRNRSDPIYQNTRKFVLSKDNPYYMRGPVINAVGGPHAGLSMAWPMANIVRILTSDDDGEITASLKEILFSTDSLGLIHESVKTNNASTWTRSWFSWANGLFGQMILDLADRKPALLKQSFQ